MGYINLDGAFIYKQFLSRAKLDGLGENDQFLKDNGWQDGTKLTFYQATVPLGWSQDVSDDNRFLRVTSSVGGGTGGSADPTANMPTVHTHSLTTENEHTHTLLQSHTHTLSVAVSASGNFTADNTQDFMINKGNVLMSKAVVGAGATPGILQRFTLGSNSAITTSSAGAHNHNGLDSQTPGAITFLFTDIIVGTKDVSGGYTDLTNEFNSNDKINFDPFALLEANDLFLEPRLMPFGSVTIFFQSSAPLGWTQTTPVNDRLLRVVSGAGLGIGGSQPPSTPVNFSHSHGQVIPDPGHLHIIPAHTHDFQERVITNGTNPENRFMFSSGGRMVLGDGTAVNRNAFKGRVAGGTFNTGVGTPPPHGINSALGSIQIAYIDVITASKNSSGAPTSFVNLTGSITFKKLVSKQRLNNLAKNDEYLKFHTMATGNKTFFTNPTSPLTWTLDTTQNGKGLRVVSGAGGGTAGVQDPGATWNLNHTHVIESAFHSHDANHTHPIDTVNTANVGNIESVPFGNAIGVRIAGGVTSDDIKILRQSAGFTVFWDEYGPDTPSSGLNTIGNTTHIHIAGNANPSFTFRFKDTILCTKN